MANELDVTKGGVVSLINNHELGDIIKPLINEVYLFDSFIAGTTHLKNKTVLKKIKIGDELIMQREDNKYDENAILILNSEKQKLGYVPRRDNIVFARLMDAGKMLKAKITEIEQKDEYFTQISIAIYLIDF